MPARDRRTDHPSLAVDWRAKTQKLTASGIIWDNHVCMPLRPDDESFLPQLERHRRSGVSFLCLNVYFDLYPPEMALAMLASFRRWIQLHEEHFLLVETVDDIMRAKREAKLGIAFDIEGGRAVEEHLGLVEVYYRLGVRWMLIAYNRNNALGGGCQDDDAGLTAYGKNVIDEMERVGMVLCCSHTGYRTAFEAMEHSRNPVILSHSNPRQIWDHERNVPDDLIKACARTGGVVSLNGIGIFLGNNDNRTETFIRHVDYTVSLIGAAHVGIGLDYVYDQKELNDYIMANPDIFPPKRGYTSGISLIEPERFSVIAEELLKRGYKDDEVRGILGENNFRVAKQVWR